MMNEYTIRCTKEQTKTALELGAPIDNSSSQFDSDCTDDIELLSNGLYAIIPTAEQMLGFLRSKGIKFHFDDGTMYWKVTKKSILIGYGWSEEKKELAAIDAALNYLKTHQTT